ncbi:MAG: heme exporter protein C [Myxococcota bacterium]|jgi:heme exporter protein C
MKFLRTIAPPVLVCAAVLTAIGFVFFVAPRERPTMGEVQRIFYFHVSFAFSCLILFLTSAAASVTYLVTRRSSNYRFIARASDRLAGSAAEVGVVCGAIVLITGPLWAKPVWLVYWTWEPRLMLMLLTEFLFVGYLVLRRFAGTDEAGKQLAAGIAAIGGPAVYFIHVAVQMWGGNHPTVVTEGGGGLQHPDMKIAFFVSLGAVASFVIYLVAARYRHHRTMETIEEAHLDLDDLEALS